ncbi:MAG: DUF3237 family protein, partial [Gemmatimonadota bacterium]
YVRYRGVLWIPPDTRSRMQAGEAVGAADYYFRVTPVFETAAGDYDWLNRVVAVGIGEFDRGEARYSMHEIV